jgi:hypothetical protein
MQQAALRLRPNRDRPALGSRHHQRPETRLAKPNYRHQKKQKELARKTRHAEKLNRRLQRDEPASSDGALPGAASPEAATIESKS